MTERPAGTHLDARDREILKDIVRTYLLSGEPVSSRAVAKHPIHGVSAATIRNVMADLEELGYLEQPHASAGRVPSRTGLHLYISSLMDAESIAPDELREIDLELHEPGRAAGELIDATSRLLARLTRQIGIVVTPAIGETVLETVDFVPLSGRKVLCVVVSKDGFIENKVVESEEELTREELRHLSNYVSANFRGLTLAVIRERLLAQMNAERGEMNRLLSRAIAVARGGLDTGRMPEVRVEGTVRVLARPELADVERVRRLLDTFDDRRRLVRLLGRCLDGSGVRVVIGEDSELTGDLGFSLVARSYRTGEGARGTLGIFGPRSMDYGRIIPLVDYLGERLGGALEASLA